MARIGNRGERFRRGAGRVAHGLVDRMLFVLLSPWRFFKFVCFAIGFGVFLCVTSAGIYVYSFLTSLPSIADLTMVDIGAIARTRVTAKREDKEKKFRWVDLRNVSREFLYAIVHSEDATFFEHNGLNFEAMTNSLAENIKERRVVFGGSTISQQVVKNIFLTPERTIGRKVRELILTRELENKFSKNEILEMYLNIAELGPDIYGVLEAAWEYFRKHPKDINAAEGAFIALMLPSPKKNYRSIFENKNLTKVKKRRIERVLRDMLYEEIITEQQYREYARYNYFEEPQTTRSPAARRRN